MTASVIPQERTIPLEYVDGTKVRLYRQEWLEYFNYVGPVTARKDHPLQYFALFPRGVYDPANVVNVTALGGPVHQSASGGGSHGGHGIGGRAHEGRNTLVQAPLATTTRSDAKLFVIDDDSLSHSDSSDGSSSGGGSSRRRRRSEKRHRRHRSRSADKHRSAHKSRAHHRSERSGRRHRPTDGGESRCEGARDRPHGHKRGGRDGADEVTAGGRSSRYEEIPSRGRTHGEGERRQPLEDFSRPRREEDYRRATAQGGERGTSRGDRNTRKEKVNVYEEHYVLGADRERQRRVASQAATAYDERREDASRRRRAAGRR